jgi:Cu(I)/Ag(I) efflux system membrane fusion protein
VTRGTLLLGAGVLVASIGIPMLATAETVQTPLYYQNPDGKPFYAAGPQKTPDGRDYVPVFEDRSAVIDARTDITPNSAPGGNRRILYYRNPMGLPDTSPVPKKDSMGMDYLPVYADADATSDPPGTVRISPGRIQTLGVRTEEAVMRPSLSRAVRATGNVQFDERHLATVTTKAAGWIERLAVAATGDPVRRGQVLAEIYAPDLVAAEEEYLVAARMGGAMAGGMAHNDQGALTAASLQRLRALDIPEEEIARLRKTGKAQRRIAVRAPADGVVIEKPAQEGMRIEAGQPLYKTADLADVWLIAEVQEQDLGLIQPGQKAEARFIAFPGRSFAGTVEFIYPTLSPETRTARVRIVIPNPDQMLRAAMYASVGITSTAAVGPVLAVPASAVIDSGARQIVLIDRGQGRFEPRPVRLGPQAGDWIEVVEGVKAGEKVVTGANFLIDAESNLRAALQGFTGPSANSPPAAPERQP